MNHLEEQREHLQMQTDQAFRSADEIATIYDEMCIRDRCRTVEISIRDNGLYHFTRQCKLDRASNLTEEIARTSFELFQKN